MVTRASRSSTASPASRTFVARSPKRLPALLSAAHRRKDQHRAVLRHLLDQPGRRDLVVDGNCEARAYISVLDELGLQPRAGLIEPVDDLPHVVSFDLDAVAPAGEGTHRPGNKNSNHVSRTE